EPRLQPALPSAGRDADRWGSQRAPCQDRRRDQPPLRGRGEGGVMTEPVGERLEDLEKSVRRAAEVIVMLRKERESLQAKLAAGETDRAELQKLRQERKEMPGPINPQLQTDAQP